MVCLGLEPGAAGWKAQTNPLNYGGNPIFSFSNLESDLYLRLTVSIFVSNCLFSFSSALLHLIRTKL